MTADEFMLAFEACTLVRNEWTHEAHVRMAWLYLTRCSSRQAAQELVRTGIKKLNAAFVARSNHPDLVDHKPRAAGNPHLTGYHDTITTVLVRLIGTRLQPGDDFPTFRDRNPDLFDRTFPSVLKHYSPERLYSEGAKAAFIEPDLAPLPNV